MAFIPIPSAIEVAVHFTIAGQDVVITLGIKVPGAITPTTVSVAAIQAEQWAYEQIRPLVAPAMVMDKVQAYDQSSSSGPVGTSTLHSGAAGTTTATGSILPNNVALVCTFYTANRGRSYRGRCFLPGLSTGNQIAGTQVSSTTAANVAIAFAAFNGYLGTISGIHSVLSRFTGGLPRVTGVATPVTAYAANQAFDSQRRRLLGRGV